MAVSFSSFVGFNSSLNHSHASKTAGRSIIKYPDSRSSYGIDWAVSPRRSKLGFCNLVPDGDGLGTETSSTDVQNAKSLFSGAAPSGLNPSTLESSNVDQIQSKETDLSRLHFSELSDNSTASGNSKQEEPSADKKSVLKRSPLTAREKVRAARVLSRYTEPKASKKSASGSKLIDALKDADKGKRTSGLPEAPTNLFDDSKRGMPKDGWTFDFPGGRDLFFIAFSFVFISTVMFATTYVVWKVGAIHFNEN